MSETRVVAVGRGRRGLRWTLEAGGDDEGYWTGVTTEGVRHLPWAGGMAGPKLYSPSLVNTYTARKAPGPLIFAGSSRPHGLQSQNRRRDRIRSRPGRVLGPSDRRTAFLRGLRMAASSIGRGRLGLRELRALGADGTVLETDDLSFWDQMR